MIHFIIDSNWNEWCAAWNEFYRINGHRDVPREGLFECFLPDPETGVFYLFCDKLGKWVHNQREVHKSGTMQVERKQILDAHIADGK